MAGSLAVVGVNHQGGDVSLRERLAPRPEESGWLNAALRDAAGLSDAVVLATCSRFEVYASVDEGGLASLRNVFGQRAGAELGQSLYSRTGRDALGHLFRVAAGLDSWIIGETEILGQVKSAYHEACREQTATRSLHLAFQRALFVGKKVRSQTSIVGGIASIGGAAAVVARRIFNTLENRKIIVFGAGTMAASTVRHLRAKSLGRLWVANRSAERAQTLAQELGGTPIGLEEGMGLLAEADVAVFSTGASNYLLDAAQARAISRRRSGRSIFMIDLGLPRNIAPEASEAEGVFVYNMDDLRWLVEDSLRRRESDLAGARAIVDEETSDLWARLAAPPVQPPAAPARCPLRAETPTLRIV